MLKIWLLTVVRATFPDTVGRFTLRVPSPQVCKRYGRKQPGLGALLLLLLLLLVSLLKLWHTSTYCCANLIDRRDCLPPLPKPRLSTILYTTSYTDATLTLLFVAVIE